MNADTPDDAADRRRQAFSLVEMVAVMALSATVVAVSTGMIVLSLRSERSFHQRIWEQRSLRELTSQLQADGHRADPGGVVISEENRLRLSGRFSTDITQVDYFAGPAGLVREASSGLITEIPDDVRSDIQREIFTFPYPVEIDWNWNDQSRLLELRIQRKKQSVQGESTAVKPAVAVHIGRLERATATIETEETAP